MVEVVVVAQGDELTTGQTVDTNSSWVGGRLWEAGIALRRVITAPDRLDDLRDVLHEAAALAPFVVCSGGLGPTRDDLTAEAAAAAAGVGLAEDATALAQVEAMYRSWGRSVGPANRKQAMLPVGARVLENRWGTAPGFVVSMGMSQLYFLPGVPREMKEMFRAWVEPEILAAAEGQRLRTHTVRVIGVAESALEEKLRGFERPGLVIGFRTNLPENQVKLRFEANIDLEARMECVAACRALIGWRAFGVDCGDLAEVVGQHLANRGETLALAESCTAGALAAWIGAVPGASRYLLEGAVVYANAAKTRTCGVAEDVLEAHGAVSEPVARQLAQGMRQRAGATWALGITGIAGPSGGTTEKPVGTVHMALAGPGLDEHRVFQYRGDRERIIGLAVGGALAMLLRHIQSDAAST
jgi:nicotinamide-nucleotide amidase